MDLGKSSSTSVSLKKLQEDGALPGRGTMEREAGGTNPQPVLGRMVAIEDYILCGFLLVPSEFLLLVLNFYGLSLLHLNPNSIAFLSIFSHLCEAYIGVEPFLDLFRFYYELRWMESNRVSGCVGFRLRDGLKSRYIPFQCPSSRNKWRTRWFYLQIKDSDPVFVVPKEQPDKISSWTAKPPLTPSLQSFIDIIDDLRVRGLSGYEVAADFVGLNSKAVERRVGQVMISGPTTASTIPVPFCEKGAAERDAAINVAASLKEKVAKEASDAAAATTSGGNVPTKGRKFSSVSGHRRKASTPSVSYPVVKSYSQKNFALLRIDHFSGLGHVSPASTTTTPCDGWREVEMGRLLEAGARGIGHEIVEARSAASSANKRADRLAHELSEAREDLKKMRELVAGNERQRQGLEHRMSELGNNLSKIRGSLRVTYTGLHQLAGECGIKSTIPANPDEFSLTSSLAELAAAMEEIPSKHAARIGEETSNGIYTGACHVLACVKLAHPELDLREILDQGAASNTRKEMMEEVGDLGESVLPLFEEWGLLDVDDEDVQQHGQPESPAIIPALTFDQHASPDNVDQTLASGTEMATTSLDLESALAGQDRRIQYWKTKFEVAELERTMVVVKKKQAVETLRGREVWFNSYLKSCCTSMAKVCRELRVPRGDPEESAAGYISWLNGACAQLDGVGKCIDEALKQECRRSSRYAGGHVLACLRDHRPRLDLDFLREGFARSRRTPAEIDHLARSMAPLAEKIFQSMDWRWPSW
uniref:Retrotransposon protein, putative, unclassified n=2 Tax=Oryza sativa subsp. japonica TaxID=39947 RepID=Q10AE3_ORYSJ|nr:retrotransposon protein, putative, unclassified [Oryza sativa Japonica Group]AAS01971.1 retrotransposon protein, putative, unclassified [Oryza sativa Japonica Group]ABF99974.1 retrotransposon protein, putative, unclassified [Oryza sativa Japonica Group]